MRVRFDRNGRSVPRLSLAAMVFLFASASAPAQAQVNSGATHTHGIQRVEPARFDGDVRNLPQVTGPQRLHFWNEWDEPESRHPSVPPTPEEGNIALAPMPAPIENFAGLSFNTGVTGGQAGAGWPPDTNGDVGPTYVIEAVNDAWGIFDKTSGALVASFTENSLWSGAGSGTPCDNSNFGDPVVVHDALADRWILSNFAFHTSGGNPVTPFYQCFAVSQTSDPVTGGWFLYAVRMDPGGTGMPPVGTLNDYPKFGIWTDCLYMSSNEFSFPAGTFAGTAFGSFSRTALYAGSALTGSNSSLGFLNNTSDPFTMIPSNLLGTSSGSMPPAGTPNYYVSESQTAFSFEVRKFTAGTGCGTGGTLGAPTNVSQTSYTTPSSNIVPQPPPATGSNTLDSLGDRMMQKVQYRKIGSVESLWVVHTVLSSSSSTTRPQWSQINVSGGTVATTPVQQQIYAPDTTLYRWMGSLAVDALGDMALGYSTSNATSPNFPSLAYSGRLSSDPLNNLSQTETVLIAGNGSQVNNCGGSACHRWGDYSSMSIDPSDDCTFWYINEYYDTQANGTSGNWHTRIGSFKFPTCIGSVVTHTVTPSVGTPSGTIAPSTPQTVNDGATTQFVLTPAAGFIINNVGGTCGGNLSGSTFTTNAVTADCTVIANFTGAGLAPTLGKTFAPTSVPISTPSTATLTLGNTNGIADTLTSSLTDTLPSGLVVATSPNASTNCPSGSVTASAGASSFSLGGGAQIPALGSCTVTVNVQASSAGSYVNTLAAGALQTNAGNNAAPASATLTVLNAPTLSKSFAPTSVPVNTPSTATLTLANTNTSADTLSANLTDSLPSGLVVAPSPNASTTCPSGSVTASAGATSFMLHSGAQIPASGSCTVTVDVQAPSIGSYVNTLAAGALQTNAGNNAAPASATLTVTAALAAPTLSKAFAPISVPVNTPSTATLTLANTNASADTLSANLTDSLPSGLVVAPSPNASTTCPSGSVTASAGATSFVLHSGAQIPASGSCTVTVDVQAPSTGNYVNTLAAGALQTDAGNNAAPASATLTVSAVLAAPTLVKLFAPANVPVNTPSTATLTLSNTNPSADTLTASLTDTLPGGLVVATLPNASTSCPSGTVTAITGAGSFALASGAQIPATGSCTVTVDVESATQGSYVNTLAAGALQTDAGDNAAPATATLMVTPAVISDRIFCDGFDGVACPTTRIDGSVVIDGKPSTPQWREGEMLAAIDD